MGKTVKWKNYILSKLTHITNHKLCNESKVPITLLDKNTKHTTLTLITTKKTTLYSLPQLQTQTL